MSLMECICGFYCYFCYHGILVTKVSLYFPVTMSALTNGCTNLMFL